MDFSFYSDDIRQENENVHRLMQQEGRAVFRALKRLEKKAAPYQDHTLDGVICFHYAHAYFLRDEHEKMYKSLEASIRHLLRGGDPEMLSRAYNLFAATAQRAGCFDVARHYFRTAYSIVRDRRKCLVRGLVQANFGDLMMETGDFRNALQYNRRGISAVKRHKNDPLYDHNIITAYINYGLNCIFLGDIGGAKETHTLIEKHYRKEGVRIGEKTRLWYRLFCAHLSLAEGEQKETAKAVRELAVKLTEKNVYTEFINDTHRFCRALMEAKQTRAAGTLIRAIEQGDLSSCSVYRRLLVSQLRIDYYGRVKNSGKQKAAYEERHALLTMQQQVQREMYRRSVALMVLASELRSEQNRVREENERLQILAETDTLTGLPNRYALNRVLEQSFDKALGKGQRLGVGIADIDDFKRYNDTYGHRRGDECLREVGKALQQLTREQNIFVARYGGDEFVLIYENRSDEQIRSTVYELLQTITIRMTHGFYNAVPEAESRPWEYLAKADARMYGIRKKRG